MKTNDDSPFFSLIVPCCNVEPYLRECMDSLLSQECGDWECLLECEESKDATETLAKAYAAQDARFRVSTAPRSGSCSVPRNRGIEDVARRILDGDDVLSPGALAAPLMPSPPVPAVLSVDTVLVPLEQPHALPRHRPVRPYFLTRARHRLPFEQ